MLARLPRIGPQAYARIASAALLVLALIVFSGAAVRLTGSGLGCPTWPECKGAVIQTHELGTHGWIEQGNRLITGVVSILAILAALGAFLRTPYRRDLAILGVLLPLGVVGQIVLGGMSVLYGLAPGWVMSHFLLSQLILAVAITLAWRASRENAEQRDESRRIVIGTRILAPLGAWVLFLGTLTTASGPHPGASGTGEVVTRLSFKGGGTLDWMIHWHGRFSTVFGLAALGLWLYARREGAGKPLRTALTVLCLLLAAQGVVGFVQYENELPAELVWVHVVLATLTWMAVMWAVNAAGRLAPDRAPETAAATEPRSPSPDSARPVSAASR